MPGSITPLPILAELDAEDRATYEKLEAPKSIVVRYGFLKMVAELPYDGEAKPGCGSKLVIRTSRGIEMAEMLTTTCSNSGCGKSVSRKQMLEYIDNSGGKDFPFTTQGRILRVATIEDLNQQSALESKKMPVVKFGRTVIAEMDLSMKLVDVEMLLGGERMIFHYTSENWIDFRELVRRLAAEYRTRIEMHQVNARDEARIVADYEKCGQQCCCKQFLKVLKPVSMRSAKVQKATLDPTKISGRCGRLMCCLRYEDETYESLRKRLPKRNARVKTPEGPGTVLDTQILTQLVLVIHDNAQAAVAVPMENIEPLPKSEDPMAGKDPRSMAPQSGGAGSPPPTRGAGGGDRRSGPNPQSGSGQTSTPASSGSGQRDERREPRRPKPGAPLEAREVESKEGNQPIEPMDMEEDSQSGDEGDDLETGDNQSNSGPPVSGEAKATSGGPPGEGPALGPDGQPRRRRRRRRGRGRGRGQGGGPNAGGPNPGGNGGGGSAPPAA